MTVTQATGVVKEFVHLVLEICGIQSNSEVTVICVTVRRVLVPPRCSGGGSLILTT